MRNIFKLFMILTSILLFNIPATAQTKTVTGTVSDVNGEPLIGVNVMVKENKNAGTMTDIDGKYSISVGSNQTLVFSYLGYVSQDVPAGGQSVINIVLKESAELLDEVIVVGYGTQKKSSLTGAISNIRSEELTRTASVTTSGTLVGKVPGISARQSDGRPGASTTIQIRNMGTPLYVIDGMPADEGQFNNLSSTDIENVSVLKDASAAIYGVRAANGVILVTTKSGRRNEKNTISASGYAGFQNMSRYPKPANAYDYVKGLMESGLNLHGSTNYTAQDLENWGNGTYQSENYYDRIVRENAPIYYGNINATGGSERSSYYLSLSHINQSAVFEGYNFKRTNLQANFDIDITKNFKVGTKINGRIEERHNVSVPGMNQDNYWGPYYAMFLNKPTESMYANNNPDYVAQTSAGSWNPASFDRNISGYTDDIWKVGQVTLFAEYKTPLKGLTARGSMSYWYAHRNEDRHEYSWDAYTYDAATDSYISNNGSANSGWKRRIANDLEDLTYQLQLNYQNKFGAHNVGAVFAAEAYKNKNKYHSIQGNPSNNSLYPLDLDEMNGMTDTFSKFTRAGFVFKANYDYSDRYYLELSGRYDGSSLFRDGDRWGLFPAISAGWRLSEEPFMASIKDAWLTNLKFRISYGQTGDDKNSDGTYIVAPYAYMEGYNWNQGSSVLNGQTLAGIQSRGLPTTTLSWMKSKMFNVGMDFDLFDTRLSGTLEYFNRRRTGIPAISQSVIIPSEMGFTLPSENLNSDTHLGIEASLIWRDKIDKVNYQLGTNVTLARQKNNYVEGSDHRGGSWDNYRNNVSNRWSNIFWGYEVTGQFQTQEDIQNCLVDMDGQGNSTLLPGDLIYKDVNGDGVINEFDERPIGYATGSLPYLNFAFNLQAEWNNFDIKMDFTGASMQSYMRQWELRVPLLGGANNSPSYLLTDSWRHADPTDPNSAWIAGKYPAVRANIGSHSNYSRASSFWMTNINYIKLRTLEVGYSLPRKLLASYGLQNLRLYVNCYNLFSLDNTHEFGVDPELSMDTGLASPTVRTVNFGFNLTF